MYAFPVTSLDGFELGGISNDGARPSARGAFAENALDVRIFEPQDAASHDLLDEAYDKLFRKFFREEEYQEPVDKWHLLVDEKKSPWKHIIGISGTNLDHAGSREVAGMFVGVYYKHASTGLLAYNIVDDAHQGTGLGRMQVEVRKKLLLAEARRNGKALNGLFAECNDPSRVDPRQDNMDPIKRIEMYAKMGGMLVPIDYTCPSGADIGDKLDFMVLLAFPHPETGTYPGYLGINSHLMGTYEVRGIDPLRDADYRRMHRELTRARMAHCKNGQEWLRPIVDTGGRYDARAFTFG